VPFTVAEFDGAIRDLEFLASFLERLSAEPTMSELSGTERHLAKIAGGASRGLRDIAARMRRALDRATRDEEE